MLSNFNGIMRTLVSSKTLIIRGNNRKTIEDLRNTEGPFQNSVEAEREMGDKPRKSSIISIRR